VVVSILGVVFLEQAISWNGERELLPCGVAVTPWLWRSATIADLRTLGLARMIWSG
jgi:hypothetical protein